LNEYDYQMQIVIDNRETALYSKCVELSSQYPNVKIQMNVLSLGDISIKPDDSSDEIVLIERKSFSDLLSSIKDGRYEEQSYRLIHATNIVKHNIIYIIEGMFSQLRSPHEKKMVMSSVISLNMFKGFSVYRTASLQETAEWVLAIASKIEKDISKGRVLAYLPPQPSEKTCEETITNEEDEPTIQPNINAKNYCSVVKKVKKDNITNENIGEIILCQIPGISSTTAVEIMKVFGTLPKMLNEIKTDISRLEQIKLTTNGKSRKIPKNVVASIKKYLIDSDTNAEDTPTNEE
jgi:ERCC4-type nuclease